MRRSTLFFACIAIAAFSFMLGGTSFAFHGGGVAHCDGCHSMHNSADNPVSGTTNDTLLKGTDASSTCLNCHDGDGGYHIRSADGSNMNQGGDFYWVSNSYTVVVRGDTITYGGDNAGHNVVAIDFGMNADSNPSNEHAPGGSYSAADLSCISCHDPHGQVMGGTAKGQLPISGSGSYGAADPTDGSIHGNYRLLADSQYQDGSVFLYDAPVATASDVSGASVAYGEGMSEWCANCHGAFIGDTTKHPVGEDVQLTGEIETNYNSYVSTGNNTGTNFYDVLVPVEIGKGDGSLLDPADPFDGDGAGESNVMCLTCHRAHASAHNNSGRWDFEVEFLAESHALVSPDIPATANPYYGDGAIIDIVTRYGQYQRSLCNKCHVQD
jgi:mono/diheme cytochrome c family protein